MSVRLEQGDMLAVLPMLAAEGVLVDAVVTDPPYHLTSIVKRFGAAHAAPAKVGATGAYARASRGFMGKEWDGGDIAFRPETWRAVWDVMKPGAHLVAFSGTRTYHRMACAIEDAGFEIRDQLAWAYGSGFPKSHDVAQSIEKLETTGKARRPDRDLGGLPRNRFSGSVEGALIADTGGKVPLTTEAAREWQGWGTALKPSFEPVCLAQKPLDNQGELHRIGSTVYRLWSALWSIAPASIAERFLQLSPSGCGAGASVSVRWSADELSNTRDGLCAQMGMSRFELALISSLSTVSSWNDTLAEALAAGSTFTTETGLSTTTDLKTLKSCLSEITPESIILAHSPGVWSPAHASPAELFFSAAVSRLRATLEHSAAELAMSRALERCPDAGGPSPNWQAAVLARKPIQGTVAANVLAHGTGAINVDACRVGTTVETWPKSRSYGAGFTPGQGIEGKTQETGEAPAGRWPANLVHDGSPEVLAGFPETASGGYPPEGAQRSHGATYGEPNARGPQLFKGSEGSAARFFYTAKAGPDDRLGSKHPTVKPVDLMRWLARLVTPPGGLILDPFAGSGTTGMAAMREGFDAILIEREAEYIADIQRRLAHVKGEDAPLFAGANAEPPPNTTGRKVYGAFAADRSAPSGSKGDDE